MAENQPEFRHLVRIANTDLNGNKPLAAAMRKIKGVSHSYANAVCHVTGIDGQQKTGYMSDSDAQKIEDAVRHPDKYNIPTWILNRRIDPEDGKVKHLILGDLTFTTESDIRNMKKIKSYRGMRHSLGQPVRGQRTRSNFRKNKGKGPGVQKSAGAKASAGGKT